MKSHNAAAMRIHRKKVNGGKIKKVPKKVFINVIKLRDNIVDSCNLHTNVKAAEEDFILTALDLGAKKDDMDTHLMDGYYFSADSTSAYIVWPELKFRR